MLGKLSVPANSKVEPIVALIGAALEGSRRE